MYIAFTVRTEINYEVKAPVADVAKELGISMTRLRAILNHGWLDDLSPDQRAALVQLAGRTGEPHSNTDFVVDDVRPTS